MWKLSRTSIPKSFSEELLSTNASEFGLLFWILTRRMVEENVFSCLRNAENLLCEYGETTQHGETRGLRQFHQDQRRLRRDYRNGSKYIKNCQRWHKLCLEKKARSDWFKLQQKEEELKEPPSVRKKVVKQ